VSYGPVLNAAAVLLACYGNVPPERAALVMGILLGVPVSAGWVDKAAMPVGARRLRAHGHVLGRRCAGPGTSRAVAAGRTGTRPAWPGTFDSVHG
jgi:hypothetical protein